MKEKPSAGGIAVRILATGCGCGIVGALGFAALAMLSSSPKQMGAGYEWIGYFIVGAFVFGGLASGIVGLLSAAFLNLRKSKEISWSVVIIASVLVVALLCYILPSFPHQIKDYNLKTSSGKENLFWLLIVMTFSVFPLLYCVIRLVRGDQHSK